MDLPATDVCAEGVTGGAVEGPAITGGSAGGAAEVGDCPCMDDDPSSVILSEELRDEELGL